MIELAAHDVAKTVLCKVTGCGEEAVSAHGRYAKLCEEHRRLERPQRSVAVAAQRVFLAASELDLALKRRHVAPAAAREAVAAFRDELGRLHEVARSALA